MATFSDAAQYMRRSDISTWFPKAGPGVLQSISIHALGTGSVITVYDNTAANGQVIAMIDSTAGLVTLIYGVQFNTGLTVVQTGTTGADFTICWN
jgi:hypothetical protein